MLDKATRRRLSRRMLNRPNNKLSSEQRLEIVRRYANDEKAVDIAADMKVSLFTVYRWIRIAAVKNS